MKSPTMTISKTAAGRAAAAASASRAAAAAGASTFPMGGGAGRLQHLDHHHACHRLFRPQAALRHRPAAGDEWRRHAGARQRHRHRRSPFPTAAPMWPTDDVHTAGGTTTAADVTGDAGKDFVARVLGSTSASGTASSSRWARPIRSPSSCSSTASCSRPAAWRNRPWVRSIARATRRSISTCFYQDMKNKLGAPGDFAQAYVIAHEVGHHVQNLFGIADKVTAGRACRCRRRRAMRFRCAWNSRPIALPASGRRRPMPPPRFSRRAISRKALNAAAAIGDDRLQKRSPGLCGAGILHPWHLGAARALVQERLPAQVTARLRYVRDGQSVRASSVSLTTWPGIVIGRNDQVRLPVLD